MKAMKAKKKLIVVLCLSLIMSLTMQNVILAKNSSFNESDINFTKISEDSWEYIHVKDGETYKVVEELIDETSVQSYIYNQNDEGKYILQSELQTHVTENKKLVTKEIENGKETVTTEDVSGYEQTAEPSNSINEELGSWVHLNTSLGSRSVGQTVGAVSIVLALFIPKAAAALVSLAALVIASATPTVYYRQYHYYKYLVGTTIPGAEKKNTHLYADSARTQFIGIDTYTYYIY